MDANETAVASSHSPAGLKLSHVREQAATSNSLKLLARIFLALNSAPAGWLPAYSGSSSVHRVRAGRHCARRLRCGRAIYLQGSSPSIENQFPAEESLELEQVIGIVKNDMETLLHMEPHWYIFAEDFKVIDQTGAAVEGLEANKLFLKLLRRMRNKFPVRDEVQVQITRNDADGSDPSLVARMKLQFSGAESQLFNLLRKDNPFGVEAVTTMNLNDKNRIQSLRLDNWLLNGQYFPIKLQLWPDVKMSDDRAMLRQKFKAWTLNLKEVTPVKPSAVESVREFVPTRRSFLQGLTLQALVILVGKGEIDRAQVYFDRQAKGINNAADSLEADIQDILVREPDFTYFAEDFTLIDQAGVKVKGLGPNKRFLKLLRNLRDNLYFTPLTADYRVKVEREYQDNPDGTRKTFLIAYWTLEIDIRPRIPYDIATQIESQALAKLRVKSFPIYLSGKSCFQFNDEDKVKCIKIDQWSVNGQEVNFPIVQFPDLSFRSYFQKKAQEDTLQLKENLEEKLEEVEQRLAEVEQKVGLVEVEQKVGEAEMEQKVGEAEMGQKDGRSAQ